MRRLTWVVSAVIILALFLSAAGIVFGWQSDSVVNVWTLLGPVGWCLAGVDVLLWANLNRRFHHGRILVGLALICYGAGQVGALSVENSVGEIPAWSWPDVLWLLVYPLLVGGLLLMTVDRPGMSRFHIALDSVLVAMGAMSALAFFLYIVGVSEFAAVDPDALSASWPYLAADAVLIGLMLALANAGGWSAWFQDNRWLFTVVVLIGLFDVTFYLIDGADANALWSAQRLLELVPPVLVVMTVCLQGPKWSSAQELLRAEGTPTEPGAGGLLPIAAVAVAVAVLVGINIGIANSVVAWLAIAATVVVLLRLGLAYRDSRALALSRVAARTDELTGLPNRQGLLTGPWAAADFAVSSGPQYGRAVLVLRLDRFDGIEDALGQNTGDELMIEVARRLKTVVGPLDVLTRAGGAQFAIVLNDSPEPDLESTAHRILAALDEPVVAGEASMRLHATAGVQWSAQPYPELQEQFRLADIAKNIAIRERVRVKIFQAVMDDAAQSLQVTVMFERALRENEGLVLFYQPIIDLQTGAPAGTEALLRWTTPEGKFMSPDEFLPLVYAAGLGPELTNWVLREGICQIAAWRAVGLDIHVSVNLVGDSVAGPLPAQIAGLLTEYRVPPDLLTVELLEDTTLGDLADVQAVLVQLRRTGIKVAIDDFGTGWSGLSYLQSIDVDVLKIDRSFVMTMWNDQIARSIVTSTIDLARSLGLIVVAEGVEGEREYQMLHEFGCPRGQGYGFSRPIPAQDLAPWWIAHATDAVSEIIVSGAVT